MIRSFLAIDLPESIKKVMVDYLQDLRQVPSSVKWVSPRQTHLTLKFFGSISMETVGKISQTLQKVISEYPRFNLGLKGIGAFPNLFRPRVIWTGLTGDKARLAALHQIIEEALASLGIPKEERPFHPHLTLGRNKLNQINEPLYQKLNGWGEKETDSFPVEELVLFKSDLTPTGPVYTKLENFPLKRI
jgi:2'-5' RNA ligase